MLIRQTKNVEVWGFCIVNHVLIQVWKFACLWELSCWCTCRELVATTWWPYWVPWFWYSWLKLLIWSAICSINLTKSFIPAGIVGRISPKTWAAMEIFLGSIASEEYDAMATSLIQMGATDKDVDAQVFSRELERIFSSLKVTSLLSLITYYNTLQATFQCHKALLSWFGATHYFVKRRTTHMCYWILITISFPSFRI